MNIGDLQAAWKSTYIRRWRVRGNREFGRRSCPPTYRGFHCYRHPDPSHLEYHPCRCLRPSFCCRSATSACGLWCRDGSQEFHHHWHPRPPYQEFLLSNELRTRHPSVFPKINNKIWTFGARWCWTDRWISNILLYTNRIAAWFEVKKPIIFQRAW